MLQLWMHLSDSKEMTVRWASADRVGCAVERVSYSTSHCMVVMLAKVDWTSVVSCVNVRWTRKRMLNDQTPLSQPRMEED